MAWVISSGFLALLSDWVSWVFPGLCEESAPNVFTRKWSKGDASLDCNTYTAGLPFGSLPGSML